VLNAGCNADTVKGATEVSKALVRSKVALGTQVEKQLDEEAFLSTLKNTSGHVVGHNHRDCETIW